MRSNIEEIMELVRLLQGGLEEGDQLTICKDQSQLALKNNTPRNYVNQMGGEPRRVEETVGKVPNGCVFCGSMNVADVSLREEVVDDKQVTVVDCHCFSCCRYFRQDVEKEEEDND